MKQRLFYAVAFTFFAFFSQANSLTENCCPWDEELYGTAIEDVDSNETLHNQISGKWSTVRQDGAATAEQWLIKEDGTFFRKTDQWVIEGKWSIDYRTNIVSFSYKDDDGTQIENIDMTIVDIDYHSAVLSNNNMDRPNMIYLTKV